MILEPTNQIDAFRPMRQQNVIDAVNSGHDLQVIDGDSLSMGRGRGVFPNAPRRINLNAKVRITTNCTDGGCYNAKLASFATAFPLPTGNTGSSLSTAALATYPDDDDTIYCNTNEIGQDTHALTAETNITEFWGMYLGINEDGKHVVEGPGMQTRLCLT